MNKREPLTKAERREDKKKKKMKVSGKRVKELQKLIKEKSQKAGSGS